MRMCGKVGRWEHLQSWNSQASWHEHRVVLCCLHWGSTPLQNLFTFLQLLILMPEKAYDCFHFSDKTKVGEVWVLKDRNNEKRTGYPDHFRDRGLQRNSTNLCTSISEGQWATLQQQEWTTRGEGVNKLLKPKINPSPQAGFTASASYDVKHTFRLPRRAFWSHQFNISTNFFSYPGKDMPERGKLGGNT